jgi:hypothetical protein
LREIENIFRVEGWGPARGKFGKRRKIKYKVL